MREGACFRVNNAIDNLDDHIYVVISDPDLDANKVVAVNFTTWEQYKDQACVVDPVEYHKLRTRSCINYGGQGPVRILSVAEYYRLLGEEKLETLPSVSNQLLDRIRFGATRSYHITLEIYEFLELQGVLPADP